MTDRVAAGLAWSLVALYGVLGAGAIALAVRNGGLSDAYFLVAWMSAYAVVGGLVASKRPGNSIGWLVLCAPLGAATAMLSEQLAIYGFVTSPGAIPLAGFATWIWTWSWMAVLAPLFLVVFLFPSGRLPSPRWRPIFSAVSVAFVAVTVIFAFGTPGHDRYPEITNPYLITQLTSLARLVEGTFGIYILILALAVLSIVDRYRSASQVEKQQLKWIVVASVLMIVAFTSGELLPAPVGDLGFIVGIVALPIAIAIAILRHRLYDIDLLINRTIVYAGLTAALGAIFFAGLVVLQGVLRPVTGASEVGVALSTLVSFTLFQPVRRGIQGAVDRRFNRQKYDAEQTLDAFSSRLGDEIDLDALRANLVTVVRSTMAPAHVSVWLRRRDS